MAAALHPVPQSAAAAQPPCETECRKRVTAESVLHTREGEGAGEELGPAPGQWGEAGMSWGGGAACADALSHISLVLSHMLS